ncbi:MAG: hypothetical protein R6U51_00480 [Anaerolineales bacterium]
METCRIVLANESRLLREMLKSVIDKSPSLEILGETQQLSEIKKLAEKHNAHWVFVTLSSTGNIPDQLNDLLIPGSAISILAISNNGEKAKIRWVDLHEETYIDWSLEEMLTLLQKKIPHHERYSG